MLESLSPQRRRVVLVTVALAGLLVLSLVAAAVIRTTAGSADPVPQDQPGPVLLGTRLRRPRRVPSTRWPPPCAPPAGRSRSWSGSATVPVTCAPRPSTCARWPSRPGPRRTRRRSTWSDTPRVDSAALDGALNVLVQEVCPGATASHGELPGHPCAVAADRDDTPSLMKMLLT